MRPARTPDRLRKALAAMLLACAAPALAQQGSMHEVKAGFLLNFMKYAEWPEPALPSATLVVCSTGGASLGGKLELLQGRQALGREIRVRAPARPAEWRECQLLFVPADDAARVDAVLRAVGQWPVLTVSDAPDFAADGGIIGLRERAGRIRFDINQGAAKRAGLTLSSQLLRLADDVIP